MLEKMDSSLYNYVYWKDFCRKRKEKKGEKK